MHRLRILILTSIFLNIVFLLSAQPKINSPYSRYGIGDIHEDALFYSQGMGSLNATSLDPWHVNLNNPASYGYLQATAFELGLDASYHRLSSSEESGDVYSGNINYFALGLPLVNPINDLLERVERDYDFGLVFALKPHSIVGYNISSTEDHPDEGIIARTYVGDGGSYKFMTGFGGRYKDFAFGVNGGYLFGKINYRSIVEFATLPYAYNNDFRESFSLSGFLYNVGLNYTLQLNKAPKEENVKFSPNKLVMGLYGNTATSFNTSGDIFHAGVLGSTINLGSATIDTLYKQDQLEGKGTLPAKIGAGIAYHHGAKWIVGLNFENTFWSQYKNDIKTVQDELFDAFKISGGASYTPDASSYTNSFARMHYRMGLSYETDGRAEGDEPFSMAALNLGLGVPFVFKRKTSHIDFSLEFGQYMGSRAISESFVKFGIGLTFNDQEWFLKRRYY